jgi:hypothetical protein
MSPQVGAAGAEAGEGGEAGGGMTCAVSTAATEVAAGCRPSDAYSVRPSEPSAALQGWMLMQGSMLTPNRAEQSRRSLRTALTTFFELSDVDGNGLLDEAELRTAFECIGMGARLRRFEAGIARADSAPSVARADSAPCVVDAARSEGGEGGGGGDPPAAPRALERRPPNLLPSRLAALLGPGGSAFSALSPGGRCGGGGGGGGEVQLNLDEFIVLMEEALAECGVEARRQWKKLSNVTKLVALGARMRG